MITINKPVEIEKESYYEDEILHYICHCNPDLAFCGKDVSDRPIHLDGIVDCVVCIDLANGNCPHCGCEGCG